MGAWGCLDELRARAAAPLAEARSLPGRLYWDPDLYELEVERIFRTEWMAVARQDQLRGSGDWIAVDLVGEPLVIVRGDDGRLRALSRVCPHRSMDVLAFRGGDGGSSTRFQCPYHLWSFRTDGSCIGATDMQQSTIFDRQDVRLGSFALEEWNGFVFVNLAVDPPPLAPRLADAEAAMNHLDVSAWHCVRTLDYGELPVNWKVVIENGVECYHHVGAHRTTLEPLFPHAAIDVTLGQDDTWVGGYMLVSPTESAGAQANGLPTQRLLLPEAPGLSPILRASSLIVGVFPMFFFALSPDFMIWFRWYPTGPESHHVDLQLLVPPSTAANPEHEEAFDLIAGFLRVVQDEDAATNSAVQRMSRSRFAGGGPLSHLEYPVWRFHQYLARMLDAPR
ncbi:MAG TPA: aromatic ring-hydroxylating dioxygenase subunit alpha [Acidimicrobiales bacterium]|nr:aromatic ring-hydroxylating dioxygenase subunit alpha [Acidimicrobiales bacterium]